MTLTALSPELLVMITQYLPYAANVSALAQACKYLEQVTTACLYANFAW